MKKHYRGTIEWEGTFKICPIIELKDDRTLGKTTYVPYDHIVKNVRVKVEKT